MFGIEYPNGSGGLINDTQISTVTTWSSNKINLNFAALKSDTPILSLPACANERTEVTITITNYKNNTQYFFDTDAGAINYTGGNTATLLTKEVDGDIQLNVNCYALEIGKTRSDLAVANITVLNVPVVADGSISNADFSANADTNDGFEY